MLSFYIRHTIFLFFSLLPLPPFLSCLALVYHGIRKGKVGIGGEEGGPATSSTPRGKVSLGITGMMPIIKVGHGLLVPRGIRGSSGEGGRRGPGGRMTKESGGGGG